MLSKGQSHYTNLAILGFTYYHTRKKGRWEVTRIPTLEHY